MTTLKERLHADVVGHMKDRNKVALTTVRNVLGEIETREKSGKTPIVLDDAQVTSLLQKEAAKRRDTARIYTEAGSPSGPQRKSLKPKSSRRTCRRHSPQPKWRRSSTRSSVPSPPTEPN